MPSARKALIAGVSAALLLCSAAPSFAQGHGSQNAAGATVWAAKYGLDDIPTKDRKRFWDAIEDLALLDVVVELCEKRRLRYDARLRKEVKSCVEEKSMRRVQAYFNKRRAHYSRVATSYACKNTKFMNSLNRFRTAVDDGLRRIGGACSLCFFC